MKKDFLFNLAQKPKRVCVIGDLIVDIHREGTPLGISAETPTMVIRGETISTSYGGAGLLVRNLLTLGAEVNFISMVGEKELGLHRNKFVHPKLKTFFVTEPGRKTTVKERFWSRGHKLLQWDQLDNRFISKSIETVIFDFFTNSEEHFDKLVISDYRHGFLSKELIQTLMFHGKSKKIGSIYVDSQISQSESNHSWYYEADLFCLNQKEALCCYPGFDIQKCKSSLGGLSSTLRTKNVVVKLGNNGSVALINGIFIETPAIEIAPVDTCGAGDAFLAALAVTDFPPTKEALEFANIWAGLATTTVGPEPPASSSLSNFVED